MTVETVILNAERKSIKVRITRILARKMQKMRYRHAAGYQAGMKKASMLILNRAKELVPYDKGKLHDSGYSRRIGRLWKTEVNVGFKMYYAIWQHENMSFRHSPGRKAKFLSIAVQETYPARLAIIKASMRNGK